MFVTQSKLTMVAGSVFAVFVFLLVVLFTMNDGEVDASTTETMSMFLPSVLHIGPPETCYVGEGGRVVAEIEDHVPPELWRFETTEPGYYDLGYLIWRGFPEHLNPPVAPLYYHMEITNPGEYRLLIRSFIDGEDITENNDVFVSVDGGPWVKTYTSNPFSWSWHTCQIDHNCTQPRYFLSYGPHFIGFAARSPGMGLDRFALVLTGLDGDIDGPTSPVCSER
ncbi:MAG: hypothetical protein M9930_00585 [Anaerolineae bacterium]|nr:hypothetical protein [Anaerolineae bacterium]